MPAPASRLVDGAQLETFLAATIGADEQGLLMAATQAVVTLLGERGACVLLNGRPRVAFSSHGENKRDWPIELEKYPEIRNAIAQRRVIAIPDAQSDVQLESVRTLLPHDLRSLAIVPLLLRDDCLGVLAVQSTTVRSMSPEAIATAAMIGGMTARLLAAAPGKAASESAECARDLAPAAPAGTKAAEERRRILIIDDEEEFTSEMQLLLEQEGYAVAVAHDGGEGVRRAREQQPDLILLDVSMPILDGFGVAMMLNNDRQTREIPILFLSSSDNLMRRVRAIKVDEMDFLAKPCRVEELLARVERSLSQLKLHERLRLEANRDELTGLGNLRFLRDRLAVEQLRRERFGAPIALLMMDVDKLKQINDSLGHAAGSAALATVGEVLRKEVRGTDLAIRYGGDEFVVLLPNATLRDGVRFAERTLAHLRDRQGDGVAITLSIGVASLEGGAGERVETLLKRADAAAYQAKRQGGNRVCGDEPAPNR